MVCAQLDTTTADNGPPQIGVTMCTEDARSAQSEDVAEMLTQAGEVMRRMLIVPEFGDPAHPFRQTAYRREDVATFTIAEIERRREAVGMTTTELAALIGKTTQTWRNYRDAGNPEKITKEGARAVCERLGVTLDALRLPPFLRVAEVQRQGAVFEDWDGIPIVWRQEEETPLPSESVAFVYKNDLTDAQRMEITNRLKEMCELNSRRQHDERERRARLDAIKARYLPNNADL